MAGLCAVMIAGSAAHASTLIVSSNDPLAGSFSVLIDATDGGLAYLLLNQAPFSDFAIRFKADFSSIAGLSDQTVPVLALFDTSAEQQVRFRLQFLPDGILFSDGLESVFAAVNPDQLGPGMHSYELNIDVATGAVSLRIDGMLQAEFSNDFAPTTAFNRLRFGLTGGLANAGTMQLDDFELQLTGQPTPAFFDDFELGNTSLWSATVP